MLEPTEELMRIAEKNKARFVFFVDAGFIWQLRQHAHVTQCREDLQLISEQIIRLHKAGHEIALHVHPHWEDSYYEKGSWKINVSRYKLANFNEDEIRGIVSKYHKALTDITGQQCKSYRAGGWCVQPFKKIKQALETNNIFTDSSVYKNGFQDYSAQSYDFRKAPDKAEWNFEDDECDENINGKFREVAITPDRLSPLFYINLYLKMKLNPQNFKPVGDGSWLKNKKRIYGHFYSFTDHFACCDGFFASRLRQILLKNESRGSRRMLVLGHPKSMAKCSFYYLDNFLEYAIKKGYKISTLAGSE